MGLVSLISVGVLAKKAVIDNARGLVNRSNSIEDSRCTYKTYVQFTSIRSKLSDFIEEHNILSGTRNAANTITDFLRLSLHQIKHWRLIFKPIDKSKHIFCVELAKDGKKKIECNVFYIVDQDRCEEKRKTSFGICGKNHSQRRIRILWI